MIQTGFETRIQVQDIVSSQLPNFILDESPKTIDFLKQYYISQEYQGGPTDLSANLDQYLNLDNLTPEIVVDSTTTTSSTTNSDSTINVSNTKGFPKKYGLLKIDNEIISYTGITTNSFTGCIRGFSGVTSYGTNFDKEEIVFSESSSESHNSNSSVKNLSSLFLKEFYRKFKTTFAPGLENNDFVSSLNVGTFLKEIKSFYQSKGTNESFRILFEILYGESPTVINLEEKLIKPSFAEYRRREVAVAKVISGEGSLLKGQGLFKENSNITASISEISPFKIDDEIFYKLSLFVGYDEDSDIQGRFLPTTNSKCTENVGVNESVVNVDSTIGFSNVGKFRAGSNIVSYTDKTVNQFLNCTGINNPISQGDLVHDNEIYYGYENGDINKKVEMVFFTTLNNFVQKDVINVNENDPIGVKNLGDKVINPIQNKSSKQILANSWIYNTNSSYFIKNYDSGTLELFSPIDKSSLKLGDFIEIVERDSDVVIFPDGSNNPFVSIGSSQEIQGNTSVILDGGFDVDKLNNLNVNNFNLRKKLNKANIGSNSNVVFKYGNESLISDIQNVYFDEEFAYVASNSLPSAKTRNGRSDIDFPLSEDIDIKIKKLVIELDTGTGGILTSFNELTQNFAAIKVLDDNGNSPFKSGEKVFYKPETNTLVGLETGNYFVEVIKGDKDEIKLYGSNYLVGTDSNISFSGVGTHTFTLESQKSGVIGPQKLLKKFPINQNLIDGKNEKTISGGVGLLINGVEITNYKSTDKVYYGPLKKINVLNGGDNFDVINPPKIVIESGLGNTALAQPVITGSIKDVLVDFDTYNFNISKIVSIGVTGGNGTGCALEPSITNTFREIPFDGRPKSLGGGINIATNQIIFNEPHGLTDGQEVIYDSNFGSLVGIALSSNSNSTTLVNKSTYIVKEDNNRAIQLFRNIDDFVAGTNPINFNGTQGSGNQKLKVGPLGVLKDIVVVDGGKGYTNKKLIVKSSDISTNYNWVEFENHGFNDGELIDYSIEPGNGVSSPTVISGLSTDRKYQILKLDDNKFRVCDAGIGGTIVSNFKRKNYIKFTSSGTGYQQFSYPKISVDFKFITAGIGETSITITPIVKGSISSVDLYEKGTGYGSSIINYENSPTVSIQNGKNARVLPIISNGRINSINVEYGGEEYYSIPDVIVTDASKAGSGAVLRAIVKNNKLDSVKVIKSGIGYSASDTSVSVVSSGFNHFLESKVRDLTIVTNEIFNSSKLLVDNSDDELKYSVCGYDVDLFSDSKNKLSGIIGWAYDGNPIYGPYGSKNPNVFSNPTRLISGYKKNSTIINDRPSLSDFSEGFFVEDYQYDGTGDLDEHNGRYEKNKDFPNGVYAYHAVVNEESTPIFPFFVGNTYRSKKIKENFQFDFDQSYDFINSTLQRNTFPYNVGEKYADNYFIKIKKDQKIVVDKITSGNIENTSIVNEGTNFKVNDIIKFDNSETEGSGVSVKVSSITGKKIESIDTIKEKYNNSILTWGGNTIRVTLENEHEFETGDYVSFSGISTDSLKSLEKYHRIVVENDDTSRLISTISAGAATTEIYPSFIPNYVSAGSTIGIGNESLTVLNVFKDLNVLRVSRGVSVISHAESSAVNYKTKSFTFNSEVPYFSSGNNRKIYFNAAESVGIGTELGIGFSTSFIFGASTISREIPVRGIYLENHPFQTNQLIKLINPEDTRRILYSIEPNGTLTQLNNGNYYAVNKSKNVIGIKTGIGDNFDELYFRGFGGSGSNTQNTDTYFFEETFDQITATAESIKTTVSVSTFHDLKRNDLVKLNIVPNLSVGIGTIASSVIVSIDDDTKHILVNPVGFSSLSISTITNQISLTNHPFKTGDKVKYNSSNVASGLQVGGYFIFKVDDNTIKLGETFNDVVSTNPQIVSIAGTGGQTHTLSLINPEIQVVKNNNLTFDLSDSSLNGYEFKIYHDSDFRNEFVSTGNTSTFNIVEFGTVGSTGAGLTVYSNNNSPILLTYNVEKSGYISTSDKDVKNYSSISFNTSNYNREFKILNGVGSTTFNVHLENDPERFSYSPSDCDVLEYSTTSKNVKGGINSLDIVSSGSNYKKLPKVVGSSSTISENAIVTISSKGIGNIRDIDVITDEFKYYTDNTLKPTTLLPSIVEVKNSNTIDSIEVESPGLNYFTAPSLVIVDKVTGKKLDTGFLKPVFNTSLTGVEIVAKPYGLPDTGVLIKSIFNDNGFTIDKVDSSEGTEFTCTLITPTAGFSTSPFVIGDEVFIEGIEKINSDGTGHNSEDYGHQFFKVVSIPDPLGNPNPNPFKVKFDVVGLSTNTGIAVSESNGLGRLIPKNQYPTFKISINSSPFIPGEKLNVNGSEKDLEVVRTSDGEVVVFGSDSEKLKIGDEIIGRGSLTSGKINKIYNNEGTFNIDFSYKTNVGWEDSIGKLNLDHQVIPNNDYYQNLSYSVKSNQTWKEIKSPIGRLVHTSGLKNFSDTQIPSQTKTSIGSTNQSISISDTFDESKVDILRGIDLVRDDESNGEVSNFLQFNKTRFVNFIDCRTNNVLQIDNINQQFSNLESNPDRFLNLDTIGTVEKYDNYLVRIESFNHPEKQLQLSEFVVLSNGIDHTIFNKSELTNSGENFTTFAEDRFGNYNIETNTEEGTTYLRFVPDNPNDIDYDLKFIKTRISPYMLGIGTHSLGFIDLTSANVFLPSGSSTEIFESNKNDVDSAHIITRVFNTTTKKINFVESYITHDGTDSYISEYYVDAGGESLDNRIGISSASIVGDNFTFSYVNNTTDNLKVNSKIIGFGPSSRGNGEYRYLADQQNSGSERTALYQASFKSGVGISTIFSGYPLTFDAIKCTVEVTAGSSKALHQITAIHDGNNAYLQQSQFLANNYDSVIGLGTFSATHTSSEFTVEFHPEDISGTTSIKTFNQIFYKDIDDDNDPGVLNYKNITESAEFKFYNAINGDRINRKQFDLKHKNVDIFKKSLNPASTIVAAANTGIGYSAFSVKDHFFRTGEELIYTPKSTFVGVGSTPMQYTIDGSTVGVLTSRVFAIRHTDDEFGIATTKAHADSGIGITVTSFGEGNAHTFEMVKSNEKALMAIDGIVQTPIANTNIKHTIANNAAPGITTDQTIFALSGISSVSIINILKVEDEYMRVDNVGVGTLAIGPITPGEGNFKLVSVERGAVGSSATAHANGTLVELYKGNYNIIDSKVNFIEAPRGNPQGQDRNGLPFSRSIFNGRVYFRNNYASNFIYDDISPQFTGIKSDFILTINGEEVEGIGPEGGQGVLFINGIFQTPITDNNPNQNYQIIESSNRAVTLSSDYTLTAGMGITQFNNPNLSATVVSGTSSGISTFIITNGSLNVGIGSTLFANGVDTNVHPTNVSFVTGISTVKFTGTYPDDIEKDFINESDVNVNQIPRGGLPISVGSTAGLGYAPLIGAKLRPVVVGGSIVDVVGVATTGASLGIQTALYDNITGILSVTTTTDHGLNFNDQNKDQIRLVGLSFTCNSGSGTVVYPTGGEREYSLVSTPSSRIFEINAGISTLIHYYIGGGTVTPFFPDLSFGSGYNGIVSVSVAVTETGHTGNPAVITGTPVTFNTHQFISATAGIQKSGSPAIQPESGTTYNPSTGILSVTATSHGLSTNDLVTIQDGSLVFSCAQDSFQTLHPYPRSTDYVSGISTAVTRINEDVFTVFVGTSPAHGGGALAFNISNGGTGYTNPTIFVSEPSYENLSIVGISRRADGPTTDTGVGLKIDAKTTPSADYTGIGSELFEISEFEVSTPGYGFFPGDKFKAVGLVTSRFIESLIKEFEMEVTETFTDAFSLWQFGEFDYMDSIKPLQNGFRTRFPLRYENKIISVEANELFDVELNPILLIFRNRVIQEPGKTYEFIGGTTINFKVAPRPEDDMQIFFYKGTDGEDSSIVKAPPRPIEIGDEVQVMGEPNQDKRLVSEFTQADTIRTNPYRGLGITDDFEPVEVIRQKYDLLIDGEIIDKSRILLEPRINPAAKIISDFNNDQTQFFIDSVGRLFNYESDNNPISVRITPESINKVDAEITATVSAEGTISNLTINNGGSGYESVPTIKIQAPTSQIGVGVGTIATATLTISNGSVNGFTITNPGLGYSQTNSPQTIVSTPKVMTEIVSGITTIKGNTGIVTGIESTLVGANKAIKFHLTLDPNEISFDTDVVFIPGNPIFIYDTEIGNGVISINSSESEVVGIGTTCLDNIYIINQFSVTGEHPNPVIGIVTCRISNSSDTASIPTTVGYSTDPIGKFSVGILTGANILRSASPISIGVTGFTINSGLSSFPTVQRIGGEATFFETGAITK